MAELLRSAETEVAIESVDAAAFEIPTEQPESDGTLEWTSTTLVTVDLEAGGASGLGYTYNHPSSAAVVVTTLADLLEGRDALAQRANWHAMQQRVRNMGRSGVVASAISAVDAALWDLRGKLLEVPVVDLLGPIREAVPVYGSGGFTSYSNNRLQSQLAGWVEEGIEAVKMKVGRHPDSDVERVDAARRAIGDDPDLMVDANGAWAPKPALAFAERFADRGVVWFEEPVSSDDLDGLRQLCERAPAGIEIAAGEYGWSPEYFHRMLEARAVDCLQADATRCLGITGFLQAAVLCNARGRPFSAHTAPALHLHPCCATPSLRHLEYFYDHVRIEQRFFEGAPEVDDGLLRPDRSEPGLGLALKRPDLEEYRV